MANLVTSVDTANANIATQAIYHAVIASQLSATTANLVTINANVATANTNIATLNTTLANTNVNVATANVDIATLTTMLVTTNANANAANTNIATLNTNLANTNINVATANANIATLNTILVTTNANAATANANIATISTNIALLSANLSQETTSRISAMATITGSGSTSATGNLEYWFDTTISPNETIAVTYGPANTPNLILKISGVGFGTYFGPIFQAAFTCVFFSPSFGNKTSYGVVVPDQLASFIYYHVECPLPSIPLAGAVTVSLYKTTGPFFIYFILYIYIYFFLFLFFIFYRFALQNNRAAVPLRWFRQCKHANHQLLLVNRCHYPGKRR